MSYTYPKGSQYPALKACGVRTIDYISPSMPQTSQDALAISWGSVNAKQSPAPAPGPYYNVLAKTSAGSLTTSYGGSGYVADFHAVNAAAYYQQTITDSLKEIAAGNAGAVPDLIFSDNADSLYGTSGTPSDYVGWNDWATATANAEENLIGPKLILNTLGNPTAYEYPPADDTIANILIPVKVASVAGAMLENTYWGNKNATNYHDALGNPSGAWVAEEDMEIADIASGKFFNVLGDGTFTTYEKTNGPGSTLGIAARMYVYASTLLSYDPTQMCGLPNPGCVLFGEEMSPPSGVDAYPEEGLLALYPLQSAKVTVNELRASASSPYVRQFTACYYRGALIGPCAIVVNPSNTLAVSVSLPQYAHSITLSGSDILDGGSLSWSGAAVTQLAPQTAAILTP